MGKQKPVFVSMLLGVATTLPCWSETSSSLTELRNENVKLRGRVEKLEGELAEIKKMLHDLAKQNAGPPKSDAPPARDLTVREVSTLKEMAAKGEGTSAKFTEEEAVKLKELASSTKRPVLSKLDLELYGMIKLDAAWDEARTNVGNFARWVEPEDGRHSDDQFSMTARQTRLGILVRGSDSEDMKTSGQVEIDFYEGGAENKNRIMMRYAYLKLDWPEHKFDILAGQYKDAHSPLVMPTINYVVGWWAGDIGYRRPQVRLTKRLGIAVRTELKLELAAARNIGDASSPFTHGDTGKDAGFPAVEGRASMTFPFIGGRKATFGVSGHYGEEEWDTDASDNNTNYDSWSANLDVSLPLTDWLKVQGETHWGANLNSYLGGIAQGSRAALRSEVGSKGGWLAASLGPWGKWRFNVGAGIEDVDEKDVDTGARTHNRTVFGNCFYSLNSAASVGLEISQGHTGYRHQSSADSMRAQMAFIYKF